MRMSGGLRSICARSAAGVSPVRIATASARMRRDGRARRPRRSRRAAREGSARRRPRAPSAARRRGRGSARAFGGSGENMSRSIAARNAASVLPEPVGARRSVESPARIGGQPFACARVGAANDPENQRRTGSRKAASGSETTPAFYEAACSSLTQPLLGGRGEGLSLAKRYRIGRMSLRRLSPMISWTWVPSM